VSDTSRTFTPQFSQHTPGIVSGYSEAVKPTWATDDGSIACYLGDAREVLASFADGSIPAVVTDPPYGIGEAAGKNKSRGLLAVSKDYGNLDWDNKPASPELINECRRISKWQVIFGGNYFELPPAKCWLVWDKMNGKTDFADCELAWTNLNKAVRRIQFMWHGMLRDEEGERIHPTQKPVRVMQWAIAHCPDSETVCDPFSGSFTTAVACIRMGKRFIGVEREPKYFEDGIKRITDELSRAPLFEPKPQVQRELLA
jgi:DNA modification methylase